MSHSTIARHSSIPSEASLAAYEWKIRADILLIDSSVKVSCDLRLVGTILVVDAGN